MFFILRCYVFLGGTASNAARLTLEVSLNAVAFRGMVHGWQAVRSAGLGSWGCQSPGWRARVCGRGASVMCAGVQAAEPAEAAAAKRRFVIEENMTRTKCNYY